MSTLFMKNYVILEHGTTRFIRNVSCFFSCFNFVRSVLICILICIRLLNNKGLTCIKHVSGHHLIIEGLKLDYPFFSTIYGFQKSIKFIISVLNKAINKDVKVQHSKKEGWCVGVLFIGMLERSVLICDTTQFIKGDHN